MISFACSGCSERLRLADEFAGKKVRCPKCKGISVVPSADEPPPAHVVTAEDLVPDPPTREVDEPRTARRPRRYDDEPVRAPKRSSALLIVGVVVGGILLLAGGVAAVGFFAFRSASSGGAAQSWQTFSPPGSSYSVSMPGTPTLNNAGLQPGMGTKYILVQPIGHTFAVAVADSGLPANPQTLQLVGNAERDNLVRVMSAQLVSETDIRLGNAIGKEYKFRSQNGETATERVYLLPTGRTSRMYILTAGGRNAEVATKTFLDSFTILEPEKATQPTPPVVTPPVVSPTLPKKNDPPVDRPQPVADGERRVWGESSSDRTIAMAISPDNQTVAVGHQDHRLRLWNAKEGKDDAVHTNLGSPVTALAFRHDGKQLAFGLHHGTVVFWDIPQNKESSRIRLEHQREKQHMKIRSLAYSPDAKTLAVGLESTNPDGEVHLWDLAAGKLAATMRDCGDSVDGLEFVPNGKLIVSLRGSARVCDASTLNVVRKFEHGKDKERFAFSAATRDGKTLAAVGEGLQLRLWNVDSGDVIATRDVGLKTKPKKRERFQFVTFSPDGKLLAFGGRGSLLYLHEAKTGKEGVVGPPSSGFIDVIVFSPDGSLLALHGYRGPKIYETKKLLDLIKP